VINLNDILIDLEIDKEPYIKKITNDKIINLTGQSGSGKSYYANQYKDNDNYVIVDTDEIFNDERFKKTIEINKELGIMFRKKYQKLPSLYEDFDTIYQDILNYLKDCNKTIIIDSAVFHCIKDISLLKGTIMIMRTSINTCYKRCIERYKKNNSNATPEEIQKYSEKKKKIYDWYHYSNKFLKEIDKL